MRLQISRRGIAVALGFGVSLVLAGCGAGGVAPGGTGATGSGSTTGSSSGSNSSSGSGSTSGTGTGSTSGSGSNSGSGSSGGSSSIVLTGLVHSGQQPISGSSVDLYVAGTSGYGTGSVSLLSGSVTTGSDGRFTMSGSLSCPSANSQVYVVATGGDAGAGDNNSTVLMAALGNCSDLGSDVVADVSEISSMAAVYALSPFMTPGTAAVGTSSTNINGLVNAFSTVNNLVDPAQGTARTTTPAGNGVVPQTRINALANIMAACVVTKGDGACSQLFSLATPPGGTTPTDTLSAMLDIALNPGNNVAQLSAVQSATKVFQPALAGAPSDWTLSIEYTGGGLNLPQLLAVDGSGNIWVPNSAGFPGVLSEFSPVGAPLSGANGFTGGGLNEPFAVAVDTSGNIWSANYAGGVSEHTSAGVPLSGTLGFTYSGLVNPVALAIDTVGDVFTANSNNTVTKLNPSGTPVAQITGGLNNPYAVAIDTAQNVWVANYGANSISKFNNAGAPFSASGYTGGMSQPSGIAIDRNGNAWVANFNRASVSELSSTGVLLSGSSGYATSAPASSVAIDGDNTVWTANTDGSISRLSASGGSISPLKTGYVSPAATAEVGIALDASGNVWTTDDTLGAGNGSIFEYIGAGAPTVTPLQFAVKNKTIGRRP
ncbi:NHL repeat-containing protein [Edaphobacter dinghuensis]|uniref:NHL repeat-containing protein n=1 Tax=Edaphobacter dinghuensis TaxID=1560005 RepID=UPI00166D3D1E|nr:NHL repeat-containing protein [Edaphobacter dinghuensis]